MKVTEPNSDKVETERQRKTPQEINGTGREKRKKKSWSLEEDISQRVGDNISHTVIKGDVENNCN